MTSKIAKKIHFSRVNKVKTFIDRLNAMASRGYTHEKLVDYAISVCMSNKTIQTPFRNAVHKTYPAIAAEMDIYINTYKVRQII